LISIQTLDFDPDTWFGSNHLIWIEWLDLDPITWFGFNRLILDPITSFSSNHLIWIQSLDLDSVTWFESNVKSGISLDPDWKHIKTNEINELVNDLLKFDRMIGLVWDWVKLNEIIKSWFWFEKQAYALRHFKSSISIYIISVASVIKHFLCNYIAIGITSVKIIVKYTASDVNYA
jgi:hypothetical protein